MGDIIMNREKLRRIKKAIAQLRNNVANIRPYELEHLASSLGREKHKRGKEPTWISDQLSGARPVSIPGHSGSLNRFTAGNIVDQLEQDVFMFEEELDYRGE